MLCLVARGASNKEIAKTLGISGKTARNHVERTYAKIGATNRIGASMYALKHGLVNPVPADRHYTGGELPGTAVPGWTRRTYGATPTGRGDSPP